MEYYTYAYLREDKSPYYIGKGKGNRIYNRRKKDTKPPKDKSRIIFLKQHLTEEEAFKHEIYMIAVFGRKDLGTGILRNKTNGGEGASGLVMTEESKSKISQSNRKRTHSEKTKMKISESCKGKITSEETIRKLCRYHYTIYSTTENKIYEFNNLRGFCREKSLNNKHFGRIVSGERSHYKGFKLIKKEPL